MSEAFGARVVALCGKTGDLRPASGGAESRKRSNARKREPHQQLEGSSTLGAQGEEWRGYNRVKGRSEEEK